MLLIFCKIHNFLNINTRVFLCLKKMTNSDKYSTYVGSGLLHPQWDSGTNLQIINSNTKYTLSMIKNEQVNPVPFVRVYTSY